MTILEWALLSISIGLGCGALSVSFRAAQRAVRSRLRA